MAFTQDQLDTLDKAIAQGVLKVKYADKEVTYQSLSDMLRIRNLMATELGQTSNVSSRKYADFSKGINRRNE